MRWTPKVKSRECHNLPGPVLVASLSQIDSPPIEIKKELLALIQRDKRNGYFSSQIRHVPLRVIDSTFLHRQ